MQFEIVETPCCGLIIFDNFWLYMRSKTADYFYDDEMKSPQKWANKSAKESLIKDLKEALERPDVAPCSQVLITLITYQETLMRRVLIDLGFKRVIYKAKSNKTGNRISTYIKVLHPKKILDKFDKLY